jgi:O-antigen/teichoic acid export membrane protein
MFFIFYSEWFMGLFGAQYRTGAIILIILSVGQFVNVSFGSVGYLLSMTGRENSLRNIMLTSSAINIILSIIGVKLYGYVGVAYATAFSTILWNALSLIVVKRHLGFWTISLRLENEK